MRFLIHDTRQRYAIGKRVDGLKPVIPAHAGIQTSDFNPVSLDSGFRRNDEKLKRVDGLHLVPELPLRAL